MTTANVNPACRLKRLPEYLIGFLLTRIKRRHLIISPSAKQKMNRRRRPFMRRGQADLPRAFAGTLRVQTIYGRIAKILSGAPLPTLIFIGSAKIVAPFGGKRSTAATFSKIGILAPPKIWCAMKSFDGP